MSSPEAQDPSIPAATAAPPQRKAADNLLLKLLEACAKHKRHHDAENDVSDEGCGDTEISKKCQHDLSSLANILPRMEETICVPDSRWDSYDCVGNDGHKSNSKRTRRETPSNEEVKHLCALYRAIARSSFCPHAAKFLFGDLEILPRVVKLFGYLLMDPDAAAGDMAEEIGNAIVSLICVLDKKSQHAVVEDLISLANDLVTVQESGVLFNPNSNRSSSDKDSNAKICIRIFSQLNRMTKIEIVSRRSLLSLQLGVWIILKEFIPKDDFIYASKLSAGGYVDTAGMMSSLISSSRPILLAEMSNIARGGWTYLDNDARIHSLLLLQTKLVISDMLASVASDNEFISACELFKGSVTPKHITLGIVAVEAARSHLMWTHKDNVGSFLRQLSLRCSRKIAILMLSTLLARDVSTHAMPYLVDLLPYLVNQQDPCLSRVSLRILHAYLLRHDQAVSSFQMRSLAFGYFRHLLELSVDPSEHVSGVSISIVGYLLENSNHTEISKCLAELDPSAVIPDDDMEEEETLEVETERKQRRFLENTSDSSHDTQGASIYSAFFHLVRKSMDKAFNLVSSIDRHKSLSQELGPKIISPIIEDHLHSLRVVCGALRVLLSLRALSSPALNEVVEEPISRLFSCILKVSQTLASHDAVLHIEPHVLRESLSLVTSLGYHALRKSLRSNHTYHFESEVISYSVIATLPLVNAVEQLVELDEGEPPTETQYKGYCQKICSRLCSVIGLVAIPSSGMCLCGLVWKTSNRHLLHECEGFLLDDVLPLKCRCILLASLCPISPESNQHDTTLTSLQRILADSSKSRELLATSLIALPNALLALASSKEKHFASRYLLSLMESFDFELVLEYCWSDIKMIRTAALLSLGRLHQLYAAAALIASKDEPSTPEQLWQNSTAFLDSLNPTKCGINSGLLSLLCFDDSAAELWDHRRKLPLSLMKMMKSHDFMLQFLHQSSNLFLAAHVYLFSVLATASRSMLMSLGSYEFLQNREHYSYFDQVAHDQQTKHSNETKHCIPMPVCILLSPFVAIEPISKQVANQFGNVLLGNQCKVFCTLFLSNRKSKAGASIETRADNAVKRFFGEMEYLFIKFFRLPHAIITFTDDGPNGPNDEGMNAHGLEIAVCLLQSLCRTACVDSAIGNHIFQQSLLRLIRIWVGSTSSEYTETDMTNSPFHAAYDAIKGLFRDKKQRIDTLKSGDFAAAIFREFFLPSVKDSIPWKRYQLLVEFIESCILPYTRSQGLPLHGLDVPNSLEVGGFIDNIYPSILTSMIFNEDISGLEMCAAFRMYIVSENKKQSRSHKKIVDELLVGKQLKRNRPTSFARDLVAGAKIAGTAVSTKGLTENMKLLCWKSHVIESVLPKLLLHSDRSILKFFADLCPPNTSLSQILQEKELTVLKTLVWELGADYPAEDRPNEVYSNISEEKKTTRRDVILALKMGYLIKEGHHLMSASVEADDDSPARTWISSKFMYLLVNVVLYRWKSRTGQEKFQTIKCLKAILRFLPKADSLQFMPQIMVAVNNAMGSADASRGVNVSDATKLQFVAVATLSDFVKTLAKHQLSSVSEHMVSIVVILFPLFENTQDQDGIARDEAVNLLSWLAENASRSFIDIPFLPITPDLQHVRNVLAKKGVVLNDEHLMSQQPHEDEDTAESNSKLQSKFYTQMNILSDLISTHDNKDVRKVMILHMTRLIQANRGIFSNMIENEGLASMQYLTVVHDENESQDDENGINGGFITKLMMRLLSRCIDESDRDIRDAIARCLGEIGAIDPNRLGKEITGSQFHTENDDSDDWRLTQPPWKSNVTRYQLRLVTRHLVSGLKSASTVIDQHKIAFAIQELLKHLDTNSTLSNKPDEVTAPISTLESNHETRNTEMGPWLKEKLDEANVRCIVEPFWTTNYHQQDISANQRPPYFIKSNSYYRWISSLCRFLVTKSHSNDKSIWRELFYACRSAVRSQAGIGVAEFILPVLVLDVICFGEKDDQSVVIDEFLAVLSFDDETSLVPSMQLREREKAVNAVFTILDVIRHWVEREMEQINHSPKSKPKRGSRQSHHGHSPGTWPIEESISKINHFLRQIPSIVCALAASSVGMNARALRFLEIDSRAKCGLHIIRSNDNGRAHQGPKFLKSQYIDGIDLGLTRTLLGKLNDFDTMIIISQKGQCHKSSLTNRLAKDACERELFDDVEGSCQAYEHLLDARRNKDAETNCARLEAQKGLLRCQLKLGRLDSVINQAYGMSSNFSTSHDYGGISEDFLPFATEAAWRLGNWSVLEQLSAMDVDGITDHTSRQQLCLGRVMHSLHNKSSSMFAACLDEMRESVMASLTSAARDSYSQSYPHLMQLHALQEVESASRAFFQGPSNEHHAFLGNEWAHRLNLSSPDSTGSNVIVNTRLALCRMANEPIAEGLIWLDAGKRARKAGLLKIAEQCLTHADVAFCSSLENEHVCDAAESSLARESLGKVKLQFAKLKYTLGEATTALSLIEGDISSSIFHLDEKELQAYILRSKQSIGNIGRLLLESTKWLATGGLKSGSEIRNHYQTILKLVPGWERAHFHYGKYLDGMYETVIAKSTGQMGQCVDNNTNRASAVSRDEKCQKLLIESVNHYGIALQLGQKHVYQALPRLLSLWLEFTAITDPDQSDTMRHSQSELNKLIKSLISKIPEHLFYTALPQLISCVLHDNKESSRNVMQIIVAVLSKYPCQTVWSCNWLRFSKSEEKKKAGDAIFNGAKKLLLKVDGGRQLQGMLDSSKDVYKFLLQLARFIPKNNATSVKMKAPKFNVPLTSFIPPIQSALSVTPGALDRSDVKEVFPQFVPRMRAFNQEVRIMQSKAKPKRVSMFAIPTTAIGRVASLSKEDDGTFDTGEMHFLVKQEAKGDLRKDSRVQDLNNVINRLFVGRKASSGSDSRRQRLRLHLRTFSVVCLSEDCGILEWVPNTDSFRSLVGEAYNPQVPPNSIHRHGDRITNYNNIELRDAFMKCQDMYFKKGNLIGAAQRFDETVLQQYLPFMYWWFVQNFPNPHAWFQARNNFTLSTAVWSAVGHIIGLGDRHSENILVDTRSGECVHVDFDCIFDKGLLLPRPEVIPFRLTPNMIDAFGPTGADGMFTGALVESMKTLRQNRDILLSVLEPFLNDPVINFSSSKNQQKAQTASAKTADAMRKIDGRLKGMYNLTNPNYRKITRQDGVSQEDDDSTHVALSVEGQVHKMIAEATSHENLVQVYVGWMPWI